MEREFKFGDEQKKWMESDKAPHLKIVGHGAVSEEGCPKCHKRNSIPTGKLMYGDRIYKCLGCNNYFGSPTSYSECSIYGIIGNDLYGGADCLHCDIPKKENFDIKELIKKGKACPYFKKILEMKPEELK